MLRELTGHLLDKTPEERLRQLAVHPVANPAIQVSSSPSLRKQEIRQPSISFC